MNALLRAVERVPNSLRALSIVTLPFAAYWAAATKDPIPAAVFIAWSVVALGLHAPVFVFDGPLPVSELGIHHGGDIHDWSTVLAIEPLGEKDLEAVLADEQRVKLRVKGRRTREDLRAAIAAYKPEAIAF